MKIDCQDVHPDDACALQLRQYREHQARRLRLFGAPPPPVERLKPPPAALLDVPPPPPPQPTLQQIQARHSFVCELVAHRFEIPLADLLSDSRLREHARPRQIAMYLCNTVLEMPHGKIGRVFHKDHTTSRYARRVIENTTDPFIIATVDDLRRIIVSEIEKREAERCDSICSPSTPLLA